MGMRFQPVTRGQVEELAGRIHLPITDHELDSIVKRVNALGGVYRDLEEARPPMDRGVHERFGDEDDRPVEDPHNAWLSRFGLSRPEANGPLSGLTVAIKDNTAVKGVPLTCGSTAFEDVVPGTNAAVVDAILDSGARIVGKTNMDELAFGPTSETSAFGPTENPEAAGHVAGGSSAGSAAAVAAGEVDIALGSDTGGSIRIPASYCGVVGIKPTFGRVPTHGVVPMAPSMDHVGPLAESVELAARALDVFSPGTTEGGSFASTIDPDPTGLTIGVAEPFFDDYVSEGVESAVRSSLRALGDRGATVRTVSISTLDRSRETWWGIAPTEFAGIYLTDGCGLFDRIATEPTIAAAIRRVRRASSHEFGRNVKAMFALGTCLLETHGGAHYVRAKRLRDELQSAIDAALAEVDVLAAPTTPTTALEIGGFERGETPPVNWDTHPTNLTGHPSVSVPCGAVDGLPVGLQFIAEWNDEQAAIDTAAAVESG